MDETMDLQGTIIGVGTLIAMVFLAYGILIGDTLLGIETMTGAAWAFTATFAGVAVAHLWRGHSGLAIGHASAAVGWLLVLTGSQPRQIALGLFLLITAGAYIAIVTLRARGELQAQAEAETAAESDADGEKDSV